MAVNKDSLARILCEVLELPRSPRHLQGEAYRIVHAIISSMTKTLQEGQRIEIAGFGIFEIRTRPPTRSPCYYFPYLKKKGLHWEIKELPAKRYVIFKPSKVLLRLLNQKET